METNADKLIDLSYLKQLASGNNKFINEMITVFIEQTPLEIGNLEKHLNAQDWKSLRATAHKMKSSYSFMGIKELEGIGKSLEEYAANEINLDVIPEMISKIKTVCTKAMQELEIEKKLFT